MIKFFRKLKQNDIEVKMKKFQAINVATPGPNFQFSDITSTTVFKDSPGDNVNIGQNIRVIVTIQGFTPGELSQLAPITVTPK